ncbi:hypothetical protein [Amaricoccus solimangrovi]|uniref:DUF883 domain-containing protein n=1 Tax=Amaricoccus solimangrovi TaxID=2589815 RepID=A0A501WT31_9RHOB|nr:hypothetical protein [Amaricoccus solimangrovi]TPE52528.1 hypothetical protein FJM51_04935 [Amaricoccus solimangrovi]
METTNTMAKVEAESHASQLRSDLRTLREDIEMLKSDVAAVGRNQVNRAKANIADMDGNLGSRLSEKPFQTLAITFAAGYLFAVITR